MFDTQSNKPQTLGEYMTIVKAKRKELDGRETYGKWTRFITEAFHAKQSADHCANSLSSLADKSER